MSHHWTMDAAELEALGAKANKLEIAGCKDLGDCMEQCVPEEAGLFSVYLRFDPGTPTPEELGGIACVADRNTLNEARAFAADLAKRLNLAIEDRTKREEIGGGQA